MVEFCIHYYFDSASCNICMQIALYVVRDDTILIKAQTNKQTKQKCIAPIMIKTNGKTLSAMSGNEITIRRSQHRFGILQSNADLLH